MHIQSSTFRTRKTCSVIIIYIVYCALYIIQLPRCHHDYDKNGGLWRRRGFSFDPFPTSMGRYHQQPAKGAISSSLSSSSQSSSQLLNILAQLKEKNHQVPAKDLVVILFMFLLWVYSIHLTYRFVINTYKVILYFVFYRSLGGALQALTGLLYFVPCRKSLFDFSPKINFVLKKIYKKKPKKLITRKLTIWRKNHKILEKSGRNQKTWSVRNQKMFRKK